MKNNSNFLSENYLMRGVEADDLKKEIHRISRSTVCQHVNSVDFRIYSVTEADEDGFTMLRLNPTGLDMTNLICQSGKETDYYFSRNKNNYGKVSYEELKKYGIDSEMIEAIRTYGFYLEYMDERESRIIIPTGGSLTSFYKELRLRRLDDGIDPFRDIYLSSRMAEGYEFSVVLRGVQGSVCRMISAASRKHHYLSMEETAGAMLDGIMKTHDTAYVMSWQMSQEKTVINLVYDDMLFTVGNVEVYPGTQILASDSGQAAITLRNILYVNESPIVLSDGFSKRNIGEIEPASVLRLYEQKEYPVLSRPEKVIAYKISKMKPEAPDYEYMDLFNRVYGIEESLQKSNYRKFFAEYPLTGETITAAEAVGRLLSLPGFAQDIIKPYAVEKAAVRIGRIAADH